MRTLTIAALGVAMGLGVAACGMAERWGTGQLGLTARDAYREGRTLASSWDRDASLRWMEGVSISSAGVALPGTGIWRLHYGAPGRAASLVVTVGPLQATEEERAPEWPSGFEIGDRTVGEGWIDSPEAVGRALAVRGGGVPENLSLLLVPEARLQWVVAVPGDARRWRLDARTGEVVTP